MEAETVHFLECVALGRQPLVTPEHARMVMQVYQAADKSAEEGRPIDIVTSELPSPPLSREPDLVKNATADRN
jgi:hypothetical protein